MTPRFREFMINFKVQRSGDELKKFEKPDDFIRTIQKVFIYLKNVN
jgi:hypothetical protein